MEIMAMLQVMELTPSFGQALAVSIAGAAIGAARLAQLSSKHSSHGPSSGSLPLGCQPYSLP